jgi:hypothetical protein
MVLSDQLKFVQDLPQMVISFDQQERGELTFTIVLLRVVKEESQSASQLLSRYQGRVKHVEDRIRVVGMLRKRYPKEALVFRLFLQRDLFMREDGSVDANEARREVVKLVESVFGAVRDYNGGLICKQHELLESVRGGLGGTFQDGALLEKFFYGITPVEMRSVLDPVLMRSFFFAFLRLIKRGRLFRMKERFFLKQDPRGVYGIIHLLEEVWQKRIQSEFEQAGFRVVSCLLSYHDEWFAGVMFIEEDEEKKRLFLCKMEAFFLTLEHER